MAAGAAVGSLGRYGVGLAVDAPLSTLLVNLTGCLAIGVLVGSGAGARARALLGTGLLGGWTTWSALAVESVDAPGAAAVGSLLVSLALGPLLVRAGRTVARAAR